MTPENINMLAKHWLILVGKRGFGHSTNAGIKSKLISKTYSEAQSLATK